jgi:hypothetical protein
MENLLHATLGGWSDATHAHQVAATDRTTPARLCADNVNLDFMPAGLRRRCSTFSKVTLAVAQAAATFARDPKNLGTVFASAHGESEVTANLLREIALAQPLSPMGFSLSVHNAASGLFSIATNNTAPATALAAGPHTFHIGLCEALLLLGEAPSQELLYVFSDDRVPDIFLAESGTDSTTPYALALLLQAPSSAAAMRLTLSITHPHPPKSTLAITPASLFATWLSSAEPAEPLTLMNGASVWSCSRSGAAAQLYRSPWRSPSGSPGGE